MSNDRPSIESVRNLDRVWRNRFDYDMGIAITP